MGFHGVRHLRCGEFVNASEQIAVEHLRSKLQSKGGDWILLSNLNHSQHPNLRSDEIDIVVIGANGVHVIEVKHWDAAFLKQRPVTVEQEAERINTKSKRIAGKLRQKLEIGFVNPRLLLTRGEIKFDAAKRPQFRGVSVFGLTEWSELLVVDARSLLSSDQIELAARLLEPTTKMALSGNVRCFANLINLERISDKLDTFHRVFRGQHPTRRDRVILHLYDLSASQDKQALELARREFETIQRWQKSPHVPSLLDSFQEAEGYPGELYFYSMVDPSAPSLRERQKDLSWDTHARLVFARVAVSALAQFHNPDETNLTSLIHRRITPDSLRVRHNGQPLFTDFSLTRLQDAQTICMTSVDLGALAPYIAPEIQVSGLGAADSRSDVYALCSTLLLIFDGEDGLTSKVREILQAGCSHTPEDRFTLAELSRLLEEVDAQEPAAITLPAPDYWDEDTIVPFQNSRYKIVGRIGQGGVGQTFKVVELDAHSDEKFGTYVAKVVRHKEDGAVALRAYRKVRAYTTHPHLSAIHEIAPEWDANRFVALMKWVEGVPLQDLIGVLPLYAEDLSEASAEQLVIRWLADLCGALGELHRVGLVHGDVSPRNIIVQGGAVILTDYDTATDVGATPRGGTLPYASPTVQGRTVIQPSDDVYALAATFFHALADRDPFTFGAERRKENGLNWENVLGLDTLRPFLERATAPMPEERFSDALIARQLLLQLMNTPDATALIESPVPPTLTPNHIPWLHSLLTAYPGSRHGNSETRGLDSDFALATYVETRLDEVLLDEIESGKVNLVILFGNAGDGKTAFLQHLAQRLGIPHIHSSRRIWDLKLDNSKQLKVNLDGSAAWQGKSANQLLDELFRPFHNPDYSRFRVHIVAINSGKLLEWIEAQPEDTYLTEQLRRVLMGEKVELDGGFRLIDLNHRSLVGGIDLGSRKLTTHFLESLLDRFLDGDGENPWQPCVTCTAQNRCTAWRSVQALRDPDDSRQLLNRLTDALQACHQRGEIHITARELRAALSYIFFGVHDCVELHDNPDLRPIHFWQRAFDAYSLHRQGELLAELARFDPALEAHPILDRTLIKEASAGPVEGRLAEGRRRAWFTYPAGKDELPIRLANARHFMRFRDVPLMNADDRDRLLIDLCLGIAHLEDLPHASLSREYIKRGVPLRITPRTPTETALWVVKPWDRFRLEAPLPHTAEGLEALHTHLRLIYCYADGNEEELLLGLELFNLLLELKEGVQLSGIAQEGVFANLEVFTQRLAREDAREIYGWHPAEDEQVFRLRVEAKDCRQLLLKEAV
jgi:serine/threonine protein kinase